MGSTSVVRIRAGPMSYSRRHRLTILEMDWEASELFSGAYEDAPATPRRELGSHARLSPAVATAAVGMPASAMPGMPVG